ncbi:hypothetical protein PRIPAC_71671 [Pristionchus pacificus]|nr:hypothetical protein PRIPAC_71671 [Pristionchus pacificus]
MAAPHLHSCCRVLWLFDAWTNSYFPSTTWYLQFDFIVTLTTIGIIAISYLGVGWRLRARQTTMDEHSVHFNKFPSVCSK